ncbi:helix-turn-helix transcriptional regulator [Ureibacillus composti]
MYGYQIIKTLKENSNNHYFMCEGTLYPALKRVKKRTYFNPIGKT